MKVIQLVLFSLILLFSFVSNAGELSNKLTEVFSSQANTLSDEILSPDIAFRVAGDITSAGSLQLSWEIEPGYYLYKNKFSIEAVSKELELGNYRLPTGKLKQDIAFGQVEVFYDRLRVQVPFHFTSASLDSFDIRVAYQGCKEDSVCYPPIKKILTVDIPEAINLNIGGGAIQQVSEQTSPAVSEQDAITQKLKDKSLFVNLLSFFGFGFLLALTPCVFPMIPILSGIIVGQGERITRTRAIALSASFVFAMALTYSILGVIAGLFNFNLQAASQNVWVIGIFSSIFVLLALSMFGFYELNLPSSWQSKLSKKHNESHHGTLKGAAIMGALSAIIVGPCVAPPLAGALLFVSQTGDALSGGLSLFAMGIGFGVPLLLIGATSAELLPRAGLWMEKIKHVFGVIMLGVAIWFLERVLPASITLLLWGTLFVVTAIFIGALDRVESDIKGRQRLWKGLGIVMLIYGTVLTVSSIQSKGPLGQFFNSYSNTETSPTLPFKKIINLADLNEELKQAKVNGSPVMLDFYADWCVVCDEMEAYTFSDPAVQQALSSFLLLKVDVTENNSDDKAFLKQFDLFGPPAILFFNRASKEIKSHRLVGFVGAEVFVEHVKEAASL